MEDAPESVTGTGTTCPLIWNNTGGTGTSEICQFEWTTKTVTITVSASVTMTWHNPISGAPYSQLFIFTGETASDTPIAGTDWSVLEPSDIVLGGRTFTAVANDSQTTTLPWGATGTVNFSAQFGTGGSSPQLAPVAGTSFSQYTKYMSVALLVTNDQSDEWFLTSQNTGGFPLAASATVFHGSVDLYTNTAPTAGPGTLTSYVVSVTANFVQPPPI